MAFRLPGEGGVSDRFRRRVGRAIEEQEALEHKKNERILLEIERRKREEAERKARDEWIFDQYLMADQILQWLEEQRDANLPVPGKEWNELFCEAVRMIPEARMYAEKMCVLAIGIRDGG